MIFSRFKRIMSRQRESEKTPFVNKKKIYLYTQGRVSRWSLTFASRWCLKFGHKYSRRWQEGARMYVAARRFRSIAQSYYTMIINRLKLTHSIWPEWCCVWIAYHPHHVKSPPKALTARRPSLPFVNARRPSLTFVNARRYSMPSLVYQLSMIHSETAAYSLSLSLLLSRVGKLYHYLTNFTARKVRNMSNMTLLITYIELLYVLY